MPKGVYKHTISPPHTITPPIERFLPKIEIKESGCWEWARCLNYYGYGVFQDGNRLVFAHRFSYEWFNQCVLPKYVHGGLQLDHLCRNRKCVNPDHLELVTGSVNIKRGLSPEISRQRQLAKTHCPHGHPYSKENTYQYAGKRNCRTCHRIKGLKYYYRKQQALI
jgi:hypothetical protein